MCVGGGGCVHVCVRVHVCVFVCVGGGGACTFISHVGACMHIHEDVYERLISTPHVSQEVKPPVCGATLNIHLQ